MNTLRRCAFWIVCAGMFIFVLLTVLACAGCAGTKEQRNALRDLTPIPTNNPQSTIRNPQSPLSPAARQIEALTRLQPLD